ncbi:3596_t:CDS:1, partial [Rhizophagus irregularis]
MSLFNLYNTKDIFYIQNDYIPVLINKSLFKNSEKAIKRINNINVPLYVLYDFELLTKKPPNSFILFKSEIFKLVKLKYPNTTSRELSKIIGNMWNNTTKENKLPYIEKSIKIKKEHEELYPLQKYKK